MKNSIFFLIFVSLLIFTSCSNVEDYLREGWVIADTIDYTNQGAALKDIETINDLFDKAIQYNPNDWDSGYSQKSQFLRILFLGEEYIQQDDYLNKQRDIYEEWFSINPTDTTKKVPYAMTLYLQKELSYTEILEEVYNENHTYNIDVPTTEDFFNFIAGVFLNKILEKEFYSTPYEDFLILSDEEILNIIIGF